MKEFVKNLLYLSLVRGASPPLTWALSSSTTTTPPTTSDNNHWKPTPCNRICRYNANVYDGEVCIGCFRDGYEISQWSRMTADEKACALEDAADRLAAITMSSSSTRTSEGFGAGLGGSVSENELRRQAEGWKTWTGEGSNNTSRTTSR
jgi:predicted Fe-S protein YdhL (DUF1289 family)